MEPEEQEVNRITSTTPPKEQVLLYLDLYLQVPGVASLQG